MDCQNCGRKIKRGYKWNGRILGIRCYKAVNPYYTDPAQAVYNAAQAILNGDSSAINLLPRQWQVLKNNSLQANAKEHYALSGSGSHAYWLAVMAQNKVGDFSVGELARFK
jgi:hypothetical protein